MTYPASDVNTSNADAGTDSPATFRADVLDLITKFNLLRNHVSTFMQGLLAATTAAAARMALGTNVLRQNAQSSNYTLVITDEWLHHPTADTTARRWTIPANSTVAFEVGTVLTFTNHYGAGVITIEITNDTLRLSGTGATGDRTLIATGIASAIKIAASEWVISGTGLT